MRWADLFYSLDLRERRVAALACGLELPIDGGNLQGRCRQRGQLERFPRPAARRPVRWQSALARCGGRDVATRPAFSRLLNCCMATARVWSLCGDPRLEAHRHQCWVEAEVSLQNAAQLALCSLNPVARCLLRASLWSSGCTHSVAVKYYPRSSDGPSPMGGVYEPCGRCKDRQACDER
jgi:hypothetical protein